MWCVNEPGLYRLIMRSDKPEGLPFPDFDRLYGYPRGGYEKAHSN
jgi:hypothetical protein